MEKTVLYLHGVWYNQEEGFTHSFEVAEFVLCKNKKSICETVNVRFHGELKKKYMKNIPETNKVTSVSYDSLKTGIYFSFYTLPNMQGVWDFIYNTALKMYENKYKDLVSQEMRVRQILNDIKVEKEKFDRMFNNFDDVD